MSSFVSLQVTIGKDRSRRVLPDSIVFDLDTISNDCVEHTLDLDALIELTLASQ